jgi:O-Antigen ligase
MSLRAVQWSLSATVVCTVLGSSSVADVTRVGSKLRWVALAALLVSAAIHAWQRRERLRLPGRPEALAFALVVLAFASTVWSVAPRLTFERATSLAVAVVATALLAAAAADDAPFARLLAEAVVGAAVVVCIVGALVYAVDPGGGAQAAVAGTPFRFRGLGENPNTVPMLCAVAIPLALWLLWDGLRGAWAAVAIFGATVIASGSRSGVVGSAAALVVFALLAPLRDRLRRPVLVAAGVAATGCLLLGIVVLDRLTALPSVTPQPSAVPQKPARLPRVVLSPLEDERGSVATGGRVLIGRDGRVQALREAIAEGNQRRAAGWGFGTEERVFVDRLAQFHAGRPENSYAGLYLQLGLVGLVLFLAFAATVLHAGFRGRTAASAGATAGAAAGLALGLGQSYVYSVGNVATVSVWLCFFLAVSLGVSPPLRRPGRVVALVVALAVVAVIVGRLERSSALEATRNGIANVWHEVAGRTPDGFRLLGVGNACLLYDRAALEVCFDHGQAVQAIDRRSGGFEAWTLQSFGSGASTLVVSSARIERALRSLGAFGAGIGEGPAYLAREP